MIPFRTKFAWLRAAYGTLARRTKLDYLIEQLGTEDIGDVLADFVRERGLECLTDAAAEELLSLQIKDRRKFNACIRANQELDRQWQAKNQRNAV